MNEGVLATTIDWFCVVGERYYLVLNATSWSCSLDQALLRDEEWLHLSDVLVLTMVCGRTKYLLLILAYC
jgi:hypothetical protein